jgi:hypothetical protein
MILHKSVGCLSLLVFFFLFRLLFNLKTGLFLPPKKKKLALSELLFFWEFLDELSHCKHSINQFVKPNDFSVSLCSVKLATISHLPVPRYVDLEAKTERDSTTNVCLEKKERRKNKGPVFIPTLRTI